MLWKSTEISPYSCQCCEMANTQYVYAHMLCIYMDARVLDVTVQCGIKPLIGKFR